MAGAGFGKSLVYAIFQLSLAEHGLARQMHRIACAEVFLRTRLGAGIAALLFKVATWMHNLAARPRRLEHINFVGKLQVVSANCGPVAGHQSCIRVRKSRREGSRIHARCDRTVGLKMAGCCLLQRRRCLCVSQCQLLDSDLKTYLGSLYLTFPRFGRWISTNPSHQGRGRSVKQTVTSPRFGKFCIRWQADQRDHWDICFGTPSPEYPTWASKT